MSVVGNTMKCLILEYILCMVQYLVTVYLAMLSVAQTEHGVCKMLGKISGMNPYQNKGKYSYHCRSHKHLLFVV
jgi:hypothetical protein